MVEEKVAKRRFRSRVDCCVGFEKDRALEFRRVLDWLIGLFGDGNFSEVPLLLSSEGVEIKRMDSEIVRMPHVVVSKFDMDNFWFDCKANRRFSLPARVALPSKELRYIFEAVGKDSSLDMVFKLCYETWAGMKVVEVRKPERCPECGKLTIYNQLPANKRGEKGDRYKCVCGKRFKVRCKTRKVKVYESQILDGSKVEVEVRGECGKEKFEVEPNLTGVDVPEVVPNIPFTAEAKVVRSAFVERLKRVKKLSDRAIFEVKNGSLSIIANDEHVKSGRFEFDSTTLLKCKGEAKSGYHVAKLIEATPPIGTATTLQFADETPILVSANPEHLTSSKIECWQAPIIIED